MSRMPVLHIYWIAMITRRAMAPIACRVTTIISHD